MQSLLHRIILLLSISLFIGFTSCEKSYGIIEQPEDIILPDTTGRIVIIGSSTAAGFGADPKDSSWAIRLQRQLIEDGKYFLIENLAKSSYSTYSAVPTGYGFPDTSRNVTKALSYNPELIILSFPTNDFAKGYTDQEILSNYKIIVNKIVEANTNYIILSTQPRDFTSFDLRKRLALFNDKLESNFPGHITHFFYKLATPNYFINELYSFKDSIHLNNRGHHLIFESIYNDSLFRNQFY